MAKNPVPAHASAWPASAVKPFGITLLLAASLFLCSPKASANIGQEFGFGSRTAALAGAGVAWGFDGFEAYHNPAALSLPGDQRLFLHYGLIYMDPEFTDINGVVITNLYTSDSTTTGNVDNDYRSTFGQEIGLTYRVAPDFYNLGIGVAVFLPLNEIAYADSGEAFVPEYFLYRARTQRPQVEMGIGADLGAGWHVGAGLHLGFALTANAMVFLQAQAGLPSTIRFEATMKPKASPYLALLFAPEGRESPYTLGAVVRFPSSSTNEMTLNSGARFFGDFNALDFVFSASSTMYYDPLSVAIGGSVAHPFFGDRNGRLVAQVDFEDWTAFQSPALQITQPDITDCNSGQGCGITISPSANPVLPLQNIWMPRIAEEATFGSMVYRFGYAYRQSILSSLPTGAGNYLDPTRHIMSLGAGHQFHHFLSFDTPCTLDAHFSYQLLVAEHITKTAGNEAGNASDQKIGAPGYDAGGRWIGGGLTLGWAF